MRNDVKTLISALTTERDSLTRAIEALMAMSEARTPERAPTAAPKKTKRRRTRAAFKHDAAVTNAIVARMNQKPEDATYTELAETLGREYGISKTTILGGWRRWATEANGAGSTTAHVQ